MQEFHCPHCGLSAFSTVCTDCQAEGIRIQKVQSVFHVGRCQRCGHLDDEPCAASIRLNRTLSRALLRGGRALGDFGNRALKLVTRVADSIRGGTVGTR